MPITIDQIDPAPYDRWELVFPAVDERGKATIYVPAGDNGEPTPQEIELALRDLCEVAHGSYPHLTGVWPYGDVIPEPISTTLIPGVRA